MSVYLDPLCQNGWKLGKNSHMVADSDDELHAFAKRIGLKREWFQVTRLRHYDLTAGRRAVAVRLGAIELGRREFVEKFLRNTKSHEPH